MKRILVKLAILAFAVACSSTKPVVVKEEPKLQEVNNAATIQLDYVVREASSNIRPIWVEDATRWAEEFGMEPAVYRYMTFQTDAKGNREIACNLAKANAKADIAGEIATFISKTLGASTEGAASIDANNPETKGMREFVENTLAEKVQAMINGATVKNTYWEKRQYQEKLGAKKDYIGFVCASLIRIEHARLKAAIDEASQKVVENADDPSTKENVKKALEKASEDFAKARKGEV